MESITFRCTSCSKTLRARTENAGKKVRCGHCKAVVVIPAPEIIELPAPEIIELGIDEVVIVEDETPKKSPHAADDANEAADQSEPVPAGRKKRSRQRQAAAGWRKVRLGLILIPIAMLLGILWSIAFAIAPPTLAFLLLPLLYVVQALPIVGHILCIFAPNKEARILAIANVAVIALSVLLTIVAWSNSGLAAAGVQGSAGDVQEQLSKSMARNAETKKQIDDLNKKQLELRKKVTAGDKDAAKQAKDLDKKIADLRHQQAAEQAEQQADLNKNLANMEKAVQSFTEPTLSARIWRWIQGHGTMLASYVQIIILCFFIQAIARAMDARGLAASGSRLAGFALVVLVLLLLSSLVPASLGFIFCAIAPLMLILGLVCLVLEVLLFIEAWGTIGMHLSGN